LAAAEAEEDRAHVPDHGRDAGQHHRAGAADSGAHRHRGGALEHVQHDHGDADPRPQHAHGVGAAGVAAALPAQVDPAQASGPVAERAGAEQVADHDREQRAHAGARSRSIDEMKYSMPDQIVTATAQATSTVVAVWGGSSTISAMIAITCTAVLILPHG